MSLAYAMRSQHLKQNPNMTMFDDWDAAAASAQGARAPASRQSPARAACPSPRCPRSHRALTAGAWNGAGFQQAAAASGESSPGEGLRRKSALPLKPSAAIPA